MSLVEILVAMAVIAIVFVAVVPQLRPQLLNPVLATCGGRLAPLVVCCRSEGRANGLVVVGKDCSCLIDGHLSLVTAAGWALIGIHAQNGRSVLDVPMFACQLRIEL